MAFRHEITNSRQLFTVCKLRQEMTANEITLCVFWHHATPLNLLTQRARHLTRAVSRLPAHLDLFYVLILIKS